MSLSRKISQVVFTIFDDSPTVVSEHTLTVSNLSHPWSYEFWEGRKQMSIGGVMRRKNIVRGFDASLSFDWEDVRNQEGEIVSFLNDLLVTKNDGYRLRFNESGGTDYLYVVPESAAYKREYVNQVTRRSQTSMSFSIEQLKEDVEYENS